MGAINAESLRQVEGNGWIVRFFANDTGLMDDKWFSHINREDCKKYIIIRYNSDADANIPDPKSETYFQEETLSALGSINLKKAFYLRKPALDLAREAFVKEEKVYFTSDDFLEAQDEYISWADEYCDKKVKQMSVNNVVAIMVGNEDDLEKGD
jgi:hypothetical protein